MLPRVIREIGIDGAAVDGERARSSAKKNARDGFLAASRAVEPGLIAAQQGRFSSAQRSSSNPAQNPGANERQNEVRPLPGLRATSLPVIPFSSSGFVET